jgi:hypothetical protein
MGNAAYIAPISPRPLPTDMRWHGTPQGRQLKSMDIPRNHDLLELEADMLAATPRWAMLPTSRPFHRGLCQWISASMVPPRGVNLGLWTCLATLPGRHMLWSMRLEIPALGFCMFGPGSRCLLGFSTASTWCFAVYRRLVLVAVLYPICWFFCNKSGTPVCSFHVDFDFCHSGNAIRRCERSCNIHIWAFSFTGDTSRLRRSRRSHAGCLAHARLLSSDIAKARSRARCIARSRSLASNGVYATSAGHGWHGTFLS